jgi:hypothetical protein
LPAITICSVKAFFVKDEYIFKLLPNNTKISSDYQFEQIIENKLNKLSIKEQFKVLYNSENISKFIDCNVMQKTTINDTFSVKYIKCENISSIRISINFNYYCFTLFSQLNGESDDKYLIDFDISTRYSSTLFIKFKYPFRSSFFWYYLHSRTESVTELVKFYPVYVHNRNFGMSLIHFRKTKVELLPKPYTTSCFDYKTIGYNSRSDCIYKCKVDNYVQCNSHWPKIYFTNDFNSNLFMNYNEFCETDFTLSEKCRIFCGKNKNCLTQIFESIELNHPMNGQTEVYTIRISPATKPNLLLKHSPKIQIDEFLCFFASIISLWFGFSVIILSDVCLIVIKQLNIISNHFVE